MAQPGWLAEPPLVRLEELRRTPARSIALAALALAIGTALWQLPGTFGDVHGEVRELRALPPVDRELRGARGVDADTRVFVTARELMAPNARYFVLTGPAVDVSTEVTLSAIAPFAGYWLLPRRQVRNPGEADWVLSYGGDPAALGLEYARVVEVAPGIALAEVRR